MVVLAPTALAVGEFSVECPCPSFSVDGVPSSAITEFPSPGPAEGLGSCPEQLCPTTWQQERCTNVQLFRDPWNQ